MAAKTLQEHLADINKSVEFNTEKTNKIAGKVTETQIEKWRGEHGEFYAVKSTSKGVEHIAYFKFPSRDEISDALTNANTDIPGHAYHLMAEFTFIGGSADMLINERLFATSIHKIRTKIDGDAEVLDF